MSSVKNVAERHKRQAQARQGYAHVVESPATLHENRVPVLAKIGKSSAGNVSSGSRLALGGVAGSQPEVLVVVDSLEFAGMKVSSVVATGCGCRPSYNSSTTGFDGESIFSFDAVDSIPANCGCDEGVHNRDSLVVDQDFWTNEAQPRQCCSGGDKAQLSHPGAVAEKENLNSEQQVEQENHSGHDKCGCGSKSMKVGHMTILPLTVKSSSLEGK